MAILDKQALREIKIPEEVIQSIDARMNFQELKEFRYEDEKGNQKKLKKKQIFEQLNERLEVPVTKYWFDKWWKLL